VIETGCSAREEVTTQGSEGRSRYDLHVEPKRDTDGSIIGITCAAIEIPRSEGATGNAPDPEQALRDRDYLLDRIGTRSRGGIGGRGLFTVCMNALRRKLGGYTPLTPADAATLSELETKRRFLAAKREVALAEPTSYGATWLIGNGWVYSYKLLSAGERQIIGFHVPGDIIAVNGHSGHTHATVTDCVFCEIDYRVLTEIRRSQTKLADAFDWSAARDEAILEQRLVTIGRRSAISRVAHLMLELHTRLQLVGQSDDDGFRCPLSQELIGDALGLTKIHVNRMLRGLRELGCLTFRHGHVKIEHRNLLIEIAEFDPTYLNQSRATEASVALKG
jgi:CRP-like cAMP-binding protein